MDMETRLYGKTVDIDGGSVQDFWNAKALKDNTLKSVLLGSDFAEDSGIRRNEREKSVLSGFLGGKKNITVLDIGCGIGCLTLKDFDSVELKSKYNAIYRTRGEYERYFARYLPEYFFDQNESGLLLDKDTGARDETNAGYWF